MRLHFITRLALLLVGAFLVVASQELVWAGDTLKWMFVAGGAIAIAFAAADSIPADSRQRAINFLIGLVGAWMIVEVFVLNQPDIKWWAFGSAAALTGLAAIGLTLHETSTERVVHELSVTHAPERSGDRTTVPTA